MCEMRCCQPGQRIPEKCGGFVKTAPVALCYRRGTERCIVQTAVFCLEPFSEKFVGVGEKAKAGKSAEKNIGGSLEARSGLEKYVFGREVGKGGGEGDEGADEEYVEGILNGGLQWNRRGGNLGGMVEGFGLFVDEGPK